MKCYFCRKDVETVLRYMDGGKTPLCPHCGIDAVVTFDEAIKKLSEIMFYPLKHRDS